MSVVWLLRFLGFDSTELLKDENLHMRLKVQKAAYLLKYLNVSPLTDMTLTYTFMAPTLPSWLASITTQR